MFPSCFGLFNHVQQLNVNMRGSKVGCDHVFPREAWCSDDNESVAAGMPLLTRHFLRTSPWVHVVVCVCVSSCALVCWSASTRVCVNKSPCLCGRVRALARALSAPLVFTFFFRAHTTIHMHTCERLCRIRGFVSHVATTTRQVSNRLLTCDMFLDLWYASCLLDTP